MRPPIKKEPMQTVKDIKTTTLIFYFRQKLNCARMYPSSTTMATVKDTFRKQVVAIEKGLRGLRSRGYFAQMFCSDTEMKSVCIDCSTYTDVDGVLMTHDGEYESRSNCSLHAFHTPPMNTNTIPSIICPSCASFVQPDTITRKSWRVVFKIENGVVEDTAWEANSQRWYLEPIPPENLAILLEGVQSIIDGDSIAEDGEVPFEPSAREAISVAMTE
jgi:hypothetical protein